MEALLQRLRSEIEDAIEGSTPADLGAAPPGKWNCAQILEHLFLTYSNTNKGIAKCLQTGAPLATRSTMKQRLQTLVVVGLGYLPEGRKAPERATPKGMPAEEVRQSIFAEIAGMAAGLDECERKFGSGTKIMDHPVLGPLTADEWRKFHWAHGRLHARQMRRRIGKS